MIPQFYFLLHTKRFIEFLFKISALFCTWLLPVLPGKFLWNFLVSLRETKFESFLLFNLSLFLWCFLNICRNLFVKETYLYFAVEYSDGCHIYYIRHSLRENIWGSVIVIRIKPHTISILKRVFRSMLYVFEYKISIFQYVFIKFCIFINRIFKKHRRRTKIIVVNTDVMVLIVFQHIYFIWDLPF